MRGLYFAKPLEYRVEVPNEQFVQGHNLQGTLSVTNRGDKAHKGLALAVGLAFGSFKALKESGQGSLTVLERITLQESVALKPGESRQVEWELPLGLDAPIQTKEAGPFLLYGGDLETPEARGQIDLPVTLCAPLQAFLTTLENHHAFELRATRWEPGMIEARLKAPASYPTLDDLFVLFKLDGDDVELTFQGKGKGLKRGEEGGVTTKQREASRRVPGAKFIPASGVPNRGFYRELVDEMLPEIAVRVDPKK